MSIDRIIGNLPKGTSFEQQMRYHQGWWRACILNEPEGPHPQDAARTVCNTIEGGEVSGHNFVPGVAFSVAKQKVSERALLGKAAAGLMHEGRLFNNLLSSQPLAFNFFGELARDLKLAAGILRQFVDLDEVTAIEFEYAGDAQSAEAAHSRPDHSAFDVAVKFLRGGRKGLLGIECKYTDSLESKLFDKPAYRDLLADRRTFRAEASYEELTSRSLNQLFRNQLILERLLQSGEIDIGESRVFCHAADSSALSTAASFGEHVAHGPVARFGAFTYQQFIEAGQRLGLTWAQREWTMMLWARYCATELSGRLYATRAGRS